MKTTLCTGKFLALVKEGRWEYVDRIGATGAAIIVVILIHYGASVKPP